MAVPEFRVVAKVVRAEGECSANHKVGDEFEFGVGISGNICCHAFGSIWPTVNMLQSGGDYIWEKEPGIAYWTCPDINNLVVFRLERKPMENM